MHPASASAARVMDSQYLDTCNALSPCFAHPSARTQPLHPSELASTTANAVQPPTTTVVSQPTDLISAGDGRAHLACIPAQSVYAITVTQAQPTLPPVPASLVQLLPPRPTPLVELQPPRHIPLVEVGTTVCTPAVQAPLTYNPVQCLVGQTLSATTLASSVSPCAFINCGLHS